MMQITKDKCGGAPGGNCKDIVSDKVFVFIVLGLTPVAGLQHQDGHGVLRSDLEQQRWQLAQDFR